MAKKQELEQDARKQSGKILDIEREIAALVDLKVKAQGREAEMRAKEIADKRVILETENQTLDSINAQLSSKEKASTREKSRRGEIKAHQQELNELQDEFQTSLAKLPKDTERYLNASKTGNTNLGKLEGMIVKLKQEEIHLSGEELNNSKKRQEVLTSLRSDLLQTAETTADAYRTGRGMSEIDKERLKFQSSLVGLSEEEKEVAVSLYAQKENLLAQQQRITETTEAGGDLMAELPEGIQRSIGFAKKLAAGMGAVAIIGAILVAALQVFKELDEAALKFREETGLTNSQMGEMRQTALEINAEYANLGVNAGLVFQTMASLTAEMGDVAKFSKETVASLVVLNTNFGIAATDSAKVQLAFESMGGYSSETAAALQNQVATMADIAGVAPSKVFADIAENAELTSTYFHGDVSLLAKQAVEARRLGTSLKDMAKVAEQLLDFEKSIEDELTASAMVGADINFEKARELAYTGDMVGMQKEVLAQIEQIGDFTKMDVYSQKALADASGMSVAEINKQLMIKEKLSALSEEDKKLAEEAIKNGLDITNIDKANLSTQLEHQSSIAKMEASFTSIATIVGSTLVPLLDLIGPIIADILYPIQLVAKAIAWIVGQWTWLIPVLVSAAAIMGVIAIKTSMAAGASLATAIAILWRGIIMALGPFGIPVAIAASLAVTGMVAKAMNIGDMDSPADGETTVSTKEGGLFKLSPNDDLAAGPGLSKALAGGGGAILSDAQSGNNNAMGGYINGLLNEIKGMRADLSAGKVSVNMDGRLVTNQLNRANESNPSTAPVYIR